jgi:hypothetical protein
MRYRFVGDLAYILCASSRPSQGCPVLLHNNRPAMSRRFDRAKLSLQQPVHHCYSSASKYIVQDYRY